MSAGRHEPTLGADDAYRPPAANLEFADRAAPDAVAIREAHIGHERQLKSVGLLFGLGAALMLLALLVTLLPGDDGVPGNARQMAGVVGGGLLIALFAAAAGALAFGYRTLAPWVKFVGTPISILGLLAIPVGTLLHGWILYLIWCEKGRRVLANDYAAIIRATPQVRYKRTVGDWIALGLALALLFGIPAMLFLV
ncbi:MAG: hypothetical protein ACRC2H_08330 [Silanimonas sp.]